MDTSGEPHPWNLGMGLLSIEAGDRGEVWPIDSPDPSAVMLGDPRGTDACEA